MATMLEIARGISQVLANSYDGATDEEGNRVTIGLKREEGHPIHDSRVMDGFSACIKGDSLRIRYHTEIQLKETHNPRFENEIEMMINKVKSHLVKEFKKATGTSLSLGGATEVEVLVEYISRVRTSVRAHQDFKVLGTDSESVNPGSDPDRIDSTTQRWLELGGLK
jgi:hypothetical protein